MKLIKRSIDRDKSGYITLYAEDQEDMWHLYNLLQKGDSLKATTFRNVTSETSTGSTDKSQVRLTLTIEIEEIDYDAQGGVLRVNGKNIVENKFVKMGGYHTISIELNRNFTLGKQEWDIISLERIAECCDVAKKADIAACVLQE
ncbi:hypothetical protein HK099_001083, partial [Clydaea vesicula]